MKTKTNRALVVGIFIFVALAIFIAAVFTLGGKNKTFDKTLQVKALFDDVNGLKAGDNVWLSGVKIGTVRKLSFNEKSQVEVVMNIEKEAQHLIRKDSKAKIGAEGFIGNKLVVIYPGSPAAAQITKNDWLQVEKAISTDDMLATLQSNNKNLQTITDNFKQISEQLVKGNGAVASLIRDSTLVKELHTVVGNFRQASANSREALADIESFTKQLNKEGSFAHDLVADTVIMNSIRGSVTYLRDAAFSASEFANSLDNAGEELNDPSNPAGALLKDKKMAMQLKMMIQNLQSGSQKLDEDLEALQHNFLLRGFFKKRDRERAKQAAADNK